MSINFCVFIDHAQNTYNRIMLILVPVCSTDLSMLSTCDIVDFQYWIGVFTEHAQYVCDIQH